MNKTYKMSLILSIISLILTLTTSVFANGAPTSNFPATRLSTPGMNPGMWRFQISGEYQAGPIQGKIHKIYNKCVTGNSQNVPYMDTMLKQQGVSCSKPNLIPTNGGYNVTMTCVTSSITSGARGVIKENIFVKSTDKSHISADGKITQTMTGMPVATPGVVTTIHEVGERTGNC